MGECPANSSFGGEFYGCNCVGETPNIALDTQRCLAECPENSAATFQNFCRCVDSQLSEDQQVCAVQDHEFILKKTKKHLKVNKKN